MFKVDELLKATAGRLSGPDRNVSACGVSTDSRSIKRGEIFIAIKGDNFDGHDFIPQAIKKGASVVIKEKGYRFKLRSSVIFIEVADTIRALGDIARFNRKKFNPPVIAVTGSNGKTTTKEMVACVLSASFKVLKNEGTKNNHIGLPMTLVNLDHSHDFAVLEIGTNHFGEVENLAKVCLANVGIITNIGSAHLEYLRNLERVF